MKRKLALLLAFVMMFTMLPMMSLSAARLGGGLVPTIPPGNDDVPTAKRGILVAPLTLAADIDGTGRNWLTPGLIPNLGSAADAGSINIPEAVRELSLIANDFPVGSDGTAIYQALVRLDGLDADLGDILLNEDNPYGSFGTSQLNSAAALISELTATLPLDQRPVFRPGTRIVGDGGVVDPAVAVLVAPGPASSIFDPYPNEILAIGQASINPTMTVMLSRDARLRDRGILTIKVDARANDGSGNITIMPAGFGASVALNFLSFTDNDITAVLTWPRGLEHLPTRVPIATRYTDDFTFLLTDDPVMFNTRTRIPAIGIREPSGLPNANPPYGVRLTLERGFQWDNRHAVFNDPNSDGGANINPTTTPATHNTTKDANVALGTQIGGPLGMSVNNDGNTGFPFVVPRLTADDKMYFDSILSTVNNEPRRQMRVVNMNLDRFNNRDRFRETYLIGDGNMDYLNTYPDGHLWVVATENARHGPVRVFVELLGNNGFPDVNGRYNVISDGWVTVAEYSDAQVLFYRDEDEDLNDYIRPSGAQEWVLWANTTDPLRPNDVQFDSIQPDSPVKIYHETAWTVLTETVRGVLPFTGLRDINFEFPVGAQILGVRWETNDGEFIQSQNDTEGEDWYFDGTSRLGSMETLINRNTVAMRPEIGRVRGREEVAEMRLQFLVSIEPEYEAKYGEELWVVASGPGFDDGVRAQVAIVRDPITVQTNRVTVGDVDIVAAGMFRHINIDPIIVHETDIGALQWNRTLEIYVEENTFVDTIAANAIILRAGAVETDADSGLEVGNPINVGRGTAVPVTRSSRNEPGMITFSDIQITGLVLPGHEYDITVVGSTVAANHISQWIIPGGWGGIISRMAHGFWADEPYKSEAFGFDGTDALSPGNVPPPPPTTQPPVTPPTSGMGPTTLFQSSAYTIRQGPQAGMAISPSFRMVTFGNGQNASAFIAAAAIGDILGWTNEWNAATNEGTFYLPDGRVVVFRNGSNQVTINGEARVMTNADGSPANAHIFNDRFMVHIRFFEQLGVNITWLGGTPGNNSMIVTP